MQNRRGLFAGMQSGRLSGFVPYKGTKDLPNAGRISRFIRNFVDVKVALCQFSMEWGPQPVTSAVPKSSSRRPVPIWPSCPRCSPRGSSPNRGERRCRTRRNSSRGCAAPHDVMRRRWPAAPSSAAATVSPIAFFFVRPAGGAERYDKRHLFFYRRRRCAFCGGPAARSGRIRRTAVFAARLLRPAFSGLVSLSQRLRRDSLRGLVAGAASGGVADPAAGPGDREPVLCRRRQPHGRRSVEPLCRRFGGRRFQGDAALRGGRFGGGSSRPGSTGKRSIGSGRNFPHGATPTISCCDDCARNAVCGKIATFAGNLFRSGRAASRQSPAG